MTVKRVHGSGSVPADVVIVGEAPGKVEAETGVPFSGPHGKYVDVLIGAIGAPVFVTNAVQRPRFSGGRIKKTAMKDVWEDLHFLRKELELVNPVVVITLGQLAYQAIDEVRLSAHVLELPHPSHFRIQKDAWRKWRRLVRRTATRVHGLLREGGASV
jgi:uracil-DNA glycosylase family 4